MKSILKIIVCLLMLSCLPHCCSGKVSYPGSPSNLLNSTVAMITRNDQGDYYTFCSGVWISHNKFLTAKHCVANDENKTIVGSIIKFKTYQEVDVLTNELSIALPHNAIVLAIDAQDIALVEADESDLEHSSASIAKGPISIGTEVQIVGHTAGMQYTYLKGIVSATRLEDNEQFLQISTAAYKGNSGGGAFDSQGNLVGICSAVYTRAPNVVLFVHRDVIIKFLTSETNQ